MQTVKLVIVGDGGVGKSCLLISYTTNRFPSEYVPTVFDNYCSTVRLGDQIYTVGFWDSAGQEDYDRLRPLSYPQTDVFLLAFAINSPVSLQNIKSKWLPEVKHHCPDTPCLLVGCKQDLRRIENSDVTPSVMRSVTYSEASSMARNLGLKYVETSAKDFLGLKDCFDYALKLAVNQISGQSTKKKGGFSFGSKNKELPIPPVMPPAGKAPWVEVQTSTFANDWYRALQNARFHDVTFIVEGNRELHAHQIVLSSASKFWAKVLGVSQAGKTGQQRQMEVIDSFSRQDLNSGRVEGIASVYDDDPKKNVARRITTVVLSADIKATIFLRVLEFLYTGIPNLPCDVTEADLDELDHVAGLFKLPPLQAICRNLKKEEEELNPSIGTFCNDETGAALKAQFLNQPQYADVVFNVQGSRLYAHRVVLSARSDVMEAMFCGHFSESSNQATVQVNIPGTHADTFLALLEYLYTDHSPIDEGDSVGIMMLANEYCVPRLVNLCELYITKEVDRHCTEQIEKSDMDVVALLNSAEAHNAQQLVKWCLHFISSNYLAFEKRADFVNLASNHRKHVTQHRWPPLSYLKEVKEFEKKMAATGSSRCLVM